VLLRDVDELTIDEIAQSLSLSRKQSKAGYTVHAGWSGTI
jgi:hypothetical protein